jgi:hypothetical protein
VRMILCLIGANDFLQLSIYRDLGGHEKPQVS